MYNLIPSEYIMDIGCVKLWLPDGRCISIDCTAGENSCADNMYERSELNHTICNDSEAYAELILMGEPETYLTSDRNRACISGRERTGRDSARAQAIPIAHRRVENRTV